MTHTNRTQQALRAAMIAMLLCAPMLMLAAPSTAAQPAASLANDILQETGIQGGLIVHVGCGDGRLTAALRANQSYIVHGIDTSPSNVRTAREHIRSRGLYGKVAVQQWDGERLPYTDNLVNLLVVEQRGNMPEGEMMRVLAPNGVAYVRTGDAWTKSQKPFPDAIDDWTHYLYDATNNAVGHDDLVASPFHLQWVDGPTWARHHNHLSSTSAGVSADGRLFTITDEGPIASMAQPPQWRLVARDAFSGVVLWKEPVGPWEGFHRVFRSGPPEIPRRLVAVGDRVYVTLGYGKPVVALDAATGDLLMTYEATDGALEIIHHDGTLYIVAGTIDQEKYERARRRGRPSPPPREKRLLAIRADTGETLWASDNASTHAMLPTTLCCSRGRVFYQNLQNVVCLDAASGHVNWRAPRSARRKRRSWSSATLVAYQDVLLSADVPPLENAEEEAADAEEVTWEVTARPPYREYGMGHLIAYDAAEGTELWRCPTALGYTVPPDVLVADGLVWTGQNSNRTKPDFTEGRDPHTGQIKRELDTESAFNVAHHHRCFRDRATDRFIVLGRTGVELIDLTGNERPFRHCWTRGACQFGIIPANGMLYMPPHSCGCYIQSKLSGFWALAPKRESPLPEPSNDRRHPGPGYDTARSQPSATSSQQDWPTFRHDPARSGRATCTIPNNLRKAWQTRIGGDLTSPVIAAGVLLTASKDDHTIHALDADTGRPLWQFSAGARIDSPPTIYRGLAIFGSADGFVYCLRLADGQLVWRFRAAPITRNTVSYGQIESLWPVTGSVLVHDDIVYCTAGRSSYLDGGMYLFMLDPYTGRKLGEKRFYRRDPETGRQPEEIIEDVELPGALPDVLVCDGDNIYLRDKRMDLQGNEKAPTVRHLYCSAGLLDDTWWHRTYWMWARRSWGRASGWHVAARNRASGRIMVCDDNTVFAYGRKRVRGFTSLKGYHLFRADKELELIDKQVKNNNRALVRHFQPAKVNYHWSVEVPVVARAMVLADDALFTAGPPMTQANEAAEPELDGEGPGRLLVTAAHDGTQLATYDLETQPVFDGLAAARNSLYITAVDGTVLCMTGQ